MSTFFLTFLHSFLQTSKVIILNFNSHWTIPALHPPPLLISYAALNI